MTKSKKEHTSAILQTIQINPQKQTIYKQMGREQPQQPQQPQQQQQQPQQNLNKNKNKNKHKNKWKKHKIKKFFFFFFFKENTTTTKVQFQTKRQHKLNLGQRLSSALILTFKSFYLHFMISIFLIVVSFRMIYLYSQIGLIVQYI